ncbi:DnaJ C-terminal domain-containing protein [Accumulibacter sp.]|uniref:DnaJ C-terminal domain-containing protein n=1 Tax=Accumulibacter sp. TaxID=2053492 RepID=UPI0025F46430|nr:DnaJ C-terminal domain-containing protein [Accumulibacter sp.]MCM8625044.1 DnaJ domain-containing protein [Accumulibacter sp.]
MSSNEDPFVVLGVSRGASPEEVKRAYRRLAMFWHPDRNPSAAAESEFKRIHAAYESYLDPQRLAALEQPDEEGAADQGGQAAGDEVGADLTQVLILTLEEAALGCRKNVELVHSVRCAACRNSGRIQHRNSVPCPACSGCGRVSCGSGRTSRCTGCSGRGYLYETACPECAGTGWRPELRTLSVTVPPGLLDGERLRLSRQAPLPPGGTRMRPGDLYLEVAFAEHPLFNLQGRDIHCHVPVSVIFMLCGGAIEVPTLFGTVSVELPRHAHQSPEQRFAGLGYPDKQASLAGDLVIHLQAIYPQELPDMDLELLAGIEERVAADPGRCSPALAAWNERMRLRRGSGHR